MLRTPGFRLALVALLGLTAVALATWISASQPVTGLEISAGDIVAADGNSMMVTPLDRTSEPGAISDTTELHDFYARQGRLADMLSRETVTITQDGQPQDVEPSTSAPWRLPSLFWLQVFVGITAFIISGWVWALRPGDLASRLFVLSGLGTLAFTLAAAIYSTRELALPASLFKGLVAINVGGASLFGLAMIALFLVYPVRLPAWRPLMAAAMAFFATWAGASAASIMPPWAGVNLITMAEMIGICAAIAAQYFATRRDPVARAILTWLGLSVLVGAGAFIALNATPLVLGVEVAIGQAQGFLLFLVIYLGLAAGLRRYRLFDLGEWAFRALFYVLGLLVLISLDALLVYVLALEQVAALGLSVLVVAFAYLPLRDALSRRLTAHPPDDREELFSQVVAVALTPPGESQNTRWQALLRNVFAPLTITEAADNRDCAIAENGLVLKLPSLGAIAPVCLHYAGDGRRLFNRRDLSLARELTTLLHLSLENREAYEKGVVQERRRIASDMHDNVGAQLLTALHSKNIDRKNGMIRETLADLRDIINDLTHSGHSLDEMLADLRAETAERLMAADVQLEWTVEADVFPALDVRAMHSLRSIIREAASNVVKHADARQMTVSLCYRDGVISLVMEDDGIGLDPDSMAPGNGLANIEQRVARLQGSFQFLPRRPGTCLIAEFTVRQEETATAGAMA